jgi:hypothetical protein
MIGASRAPARPRQRLVPMRAAHGTWSGIRHIQAGVPLGCRSVVSLAIGFALCPSLLATTPAAAAAPCEAFDPPAAVVSAGEHERATDDVPPPATGATAGTTTGSDTDTTKAPSKIRSPEDGALDLSGFLDKAYGFVPILIPITEPAIGYGAALGVMFIDKPQGEAQPGLARPNITAVGAFATGNGTWGVLAGDVRHWKDDRVQTVVGALYSSVNLDFYGIGKDNALKDDPIGYTLEPVGGGARGRYRFGASHVWGGIGYVLADTNVSFDEEGRLPQAGEFSTQSHVGGLTPSLAYDTRDNMFTPTRGSYADGTVGLFDERLGSDTTFQRVNLTYIVYLPVHARVTLGVRGGATFAFGDVPFYLLPFISLRGAPVMRYQGQDVAEVETEVRWQFWKRYSLVGFVGGGAAWNDFQHLDNQVDVVTGGTGFRYELARKYGLHAGADVAFGPDGTAFYVQVGSAWARP